MAGEKWEIDAFRITLDDLILLDEIRSTMAGKVRPFKALLCRVVVNKSEEEIGNLAIPELLELANHIGKAVEETALPKETESASPTS